ncbi:MAG: flavodoxin family protein [candidate division Zixibacteria bacterium]
MIIAGLSGSPVGGSSTDILVNAVLEGASGDNSRTRFIRLNDQIILPCQACGKSPEPDYCFFHDDMDPIYTLMAKADGIILGSPIYFDSVSAQAKLFIDRTNCLRPVDFTDKDNPSFKEPLFKGKKGGIIIVGGEKEKFDTALRTARGFFIWAGIDIVFELKFAASGFDIGEAGKDSTIIEKARSYGENLASSISGK